MSARVLVVDDSLTVRMNLVEIFAAADFEVEECGTLAAARTRLAAGDFDLLLLDVLLPDGDGVDFLAELRASEATRSMPIMLLSSESEVRDRVRGLAQGADDYLGKPYDATYVTARARELLRARTASSSPQQTTILLIEDSATYRAELSRALQAAGYAVLCATSGEEGLRMAAESRPDAILVDGLLPGIDGVTVIRRVRLDAALRRTPCILLTASEEKGAEMRAFDAGADTFVRKRDDLEVVITRLATVLRSSRARSRDHETTSLLGPKKVMAVDDSQAYLQTLGEVLRADRYEVVLARSGEEALELLALQPMDCILLDLMMPGIGGTETCLRIKSSPSTRDTPIIILTAREGREAMLAGLEAGADDFIAKSSDFEVLRARVTAQLRRKQFEDETRGYRERLLRQEAEEAETRAARALAEVRAELIEDLERKNKELDAFSYSVSHDLRAPLRAIDGFSRVLAEAHSEQLDAEGLEYLARLRAAAKRMGELIDDLLGLARVGRVELRMETVALSSLVHAVAAELAQREPERAVTLDIEPGVEVRADSRLLRIVLENLVGNAWKFTAKTEAARVEFGRSVRADGKVVYWVRDNGAGFDMSRAGLLFAPFQRLHSTKDFAGTGVGLATVRRIIERHGGEIWAEGAVGQGARISFTLSAPRTRSQV